MVPVAVNFDPPASVVFVTVGVPITATSLLP